MAPESASAAAPAAMARERAPTLSMVRAVSIAPEMSPLRACSDAIATMAS